MSTSDSPRDQQDLQGVHRAIREGVLNREFGGIIWQFAGGGGIHLAIVSSPYERNPQIPHMCTQAPSLLASGRIIQQDSVNTDTHMFLTQSLTITENYIYF